jgi:hypothetical protein
MPDRVGATISVRPEAQYLSTRDLAALLGRSTTKRGLERLRVQLHRFRVAYRGHALRPRWHVDTARTLLAR